MIAYGEIMEDNQIPVKIEMINKVDSLLSNALVAALAWNDAVKELLAKYKKGEDTKTLFGYALLVTTVAVAGTTGIKVISREIKKMLEE